MTTATYVKYNPVFTVDQPVVRVDGCENSKFKVTGTVKIKPEKRVKITSVVVSFVGIQKTRKKYGVKLDRVIIPINWKAIAGKMAPEQGEKHLPYLILEQQKDYSFPFELEIPGDLRDTIRRMHGAPHKQPVYSLKYEVKASVQIGAKESVLKTMPVVITRQEVNSNVGQTSRLVKINDHQLTIRYNRHGSLLHFNEIWFEIDRSVHPKPVFDIYVQMNQTTTTEDGVSTTNTVFARNHAMMEYRSQPKSDHRGYRAIFYVPHHPQSGINQTIVNQPVTNTHELCIVVIERTGRHLDEMKPPINFTLPIELRVPPNCKHIDKSGYLYSSEENKPKLFAGL